MLLVGASRYILWDLIPFNVPGSWTCRFYVGSSQNLYELIHIKRYLCHTEFKSAAVKINTTGYPVFIYITVIKGTIYCVLKLPVSPLNKYKNGIYKF